MQPDTIHDRKTPGSIQVLNRQRLYAISRTSVALLGEEALRALGRGGAVVSVVFVNPREMRSVNRKFLGRDYATDVLSFSYRGEMLEGKRFLGEILVAPEVAAAHAARYGTTADREIRKLVVHGILHLLGYNHETDRGRMNRIQGRLLRRKALFAVPPLTVRKENR